MKKVLYHTDELFRLIDGRLKEAGVLPDILDYGLPTQEHHAIKTISWDTIGIVNFGSSEGIYLDIYLVGDIGGRKAERVKLGTYKTLGEDKGAFRAMSALNAEFVFTMREFVDAHIEDFNWIGYDIHFYRDGRRAVSYTTARDLASAKEFVRERGRRDGYEYAILINNETGKEERVQCPAAE